MKQKIYPERFWVKGSNGWFSIEVTERERISLLYLRSMGVEYDDE